ncbi:MAG: HAD family hydrolase [Kofleriaceae bacterium]
MKPRVRLLVTDLDNTLYDWVTFFATSFMEMVEAATRILAADKEKLLDDLRLVHRKYHNSEHPFALLETDTVRSTLVGATPEQCADRLNEAFHAFNSARKRTLRLYPSVLETLTELSAQGVRIVAHTEATVTNAQFRLSKLGIAKFIDRLYALEHVGEHPRAAGAEIVAGVKNVRLIRHDERKPDPRVLRDISRDTQTPLNEILYVGDSIVRDIGMAKEAGAWAAWAKYGTEFAPEHWRTLVRVTHWTSEDIARSETDKRRLGNAHPDQVLDTFSDILHHFDFEHI